MTCAITRQLSGPGDSGLDQTRPFPSSGERGLAPHFAGDTLIWQHFSAEPSYRGQCKKLICTNSKGFRDGQVWIPSEPLRHLLVPMSESVPGGTGSPAHPPSSPRQLQISVTNLHTEIDITASWLYQQGPREAHLIVDLPLWGNKKCNNLRAMPGISLRGISAFSHSGE